MRSTSNVAAFSQPGGRSLVHWRGEVGCCAPVPSSRNLDGSQAVGNLAHLFAAACAIGSEGLRVSRAGQDLPLNRAGLRSAETPTPMENAACNLARLTPAARPPRRIVAFAPLIPAPVAR